MVELDKLFSSLAPSQADTSFLDELVASSEDETLPSVPAKTLSFEEQLIAAMPIPAIELTPAEEQACSTYQNARRLLGPVASLVMVCDVKCPIIKQCPLAKVKKTPYGERCPFETNMVMQSFTDWAKDCGVDPNRMAQVDKVNISTLVSIDLRESRCNAILAEAKNAHLTSRSVRDVDIETSKIICWEDVIHINQQILEQLHVQRARLLKMYDLTPEQQNKRQKNQQFAANNLASRQSDNADKLRRAAERRRLKAIDSTTV